MQIRALARWVGIFLFVFSAAQGRAEFETGELSGVARVEVVLDPFSFAPELVRELHRKASLSPFQTELLRRLENGSSGSAFCIYPGLLVTNAHVIFAGARYPGLRLSPEQWASLEAEIIASMRPWISLGSYAGGRLRLSAEVVGLDLEKDLALLHCYDPKGLLLPLQLADPGRLKVGLPIVVVGYNAEGLKVTRGRVESLIRGQRVLEPARVRSRPGEGCPPLVVGAEKGEVVRIQHSAPTEAGISGGPLLDEEGKVLGVAYGLLRPINKEGNSPNLHLAISVGVVKKFLEGRDIEIPPSALLRPSLEPSEGASPQAPAPGPSLSPAWAGSAQELSDIERRIEMGNGAAVIPLLETRLRRNRFDFRARALLSQAHYQESRFAGQSTAHLFPAFYQAAWLACFAPQAEFGKEAGEFIQEPRIRNSVARCASTPEARALLLSLDIQARLNEFLASGRVSEAHQSACAEMETMLVECERARALSARSDLVSTAALVNACLAVEQAWGVRPGQPDEKDEEVLKKRTALLKKALLLAEPLAVRLDRSPGAQSLLGLVCARLGRLAGDPEVLQKALLAYERASSLDPNSPSVKAALAALRI